MEQRISKKVATVLGAVVLFTSSCKDEITGVEEIVFPASNVSYSKHVDPLFQQKCALGGCHAGSNPTGGLNLMTPSYNNLMNHIPRLVTSGQSNNSLLVQRLDGRVQPRMPFGRDPINDNQLNGIKKWIDEGALNN